jgi:hypothetical protein
MGAKTIALSSQRMWTEESSSLGLVSMTNPLSSKAMWLETPALSSQSLQHMAIAQTSQSSSTQHLLGPQSISLRATHQLGQARHTMKQLVQQNTR